MKKIVCLFVCFIMCLSLFASCGKTDLSKDAEGEAYNASPSLGDGVGEFAMDSPAKKDGTVSYGEAKSGAKDDGARAEEGEITPMVPAEAGDAPSEGSGETDQIVPSPFKLTAGEWNDNDAWAFFSNLITGKKISFPSFGLDPTKRIAVSVKDGDVPIRDMKVTLLSGDKTVWNAKTDKNGNAYLFYAEEGEFEVALETGERKTVELQGVRGDAQSQSGKFDVCTSEVAFDIPASSGPLEKTEVMFILDTTGSMGDEIAFLQKDFASIAKEVAREGMTFSMNFYRDEGDAYVTKCNGFTSDPDEILSLLSKETADGGGDAPEAVAEILRETLEKAQWSENSNKIAFLIFDAPPHYGKNEMIESAVRSAAVKGVKVVPVVASNADRETELFGRALAIMTNANYVFLTDDSGIGGSHLEPIIGDYKVELLHDIIVRNINDVAS